jgi:RHS repeat-associated protein
MVTLARTTSERTPQRFRCGGGWQKSVQSSKSVDHPSSACLHRLRCANRFLFIGRNADAHGNTLSFTGPGTGGVRFTDDDSGSGFTSDANELIYCGYPDHGVVIMVIGTGLYDPETELHYVRNRIYVMAVFGPPLGRWLQRDPIGVAGGINLYEYVGGRAVVALDPSGFASFALPPFTLPITPGSLLWTPPGPLYQQYQEDQALANYWFGQTLKLLPTDPGYTNALQQWSKYQNASSNLLGQMSNQLEQGMGGGSARLLAEAVQIGTRSRIGPRASGLALHS